MPGSDCRYLWIDLGQAAVSRPAKVHAGKGYDYDGSDHPGLGPATTLRSPGPLRRGLTLDHYLVESSDLTVDAVAARTGLGTAANPRLHLRRAAATTPSAYRTTFRGETLSQAAAR
jgi:hypothetical protein